MHELIKPLYFLHTINVQPTTNRSERRVLRPDVLRRRHQPEVPGLENRELPLQ